MFIEDGFKDCCDEMENVSFEDAFQVEVEKDWIKAEKDNYAFCVGQKEQLSLATDSVKILAGLRDGV